MPTLQLPHRACNMSRRSLLQIGLLHRLVIAAMISTVVWVGIILVTA